MSRIPRLYAIADRQFGDPVEIGARLFVGGARLVQVRDKTASAGQLLDEVRRLMEISPGDGVVVVNDRADVARIASAGGVHLGQSDLPVSAARALLGPDVLVGLSTHNVDQAREAARLPIDYLAAGPVFPTTSKADPDATIGLDGLQEICRLSHVPVVAIGGIRLDDVGRVLDAGASSIAAISDLLSNGDIEGRTRRYATRLESV